MTASNLTLSAELDNTEQEAWDEYRAACIAHSSRPTKVTGFALLRTARRYYFLTETPETADRFLQHRVAQLRWEGLL